MVIAAPIQSKSEIIWCLERKRRIEKIREEEFGEELEEAMYKKKPNLRRKVHSTKLYRQLC
jgi:hypothetical protein